MAAEARADQGRVPGPCAVALQVLPMDAADDDEVCRVVDEVIAYIASCPVSLFVGPFESTFEGEFDQCMEILAECQRVAMAAGAGKLFCVAKIDTREGDPLTTERKVGKYATLNAERFDGADEGERYLNVV